MRKNSLLLGLGTLVSALAALIATSGVHTLGQLVLMNGVGPGIQ